MVASAPPSGQLADAFGINTVYEVCAFLPVIGLLALFCRM